MNKKMVILWSFLNVDLLFSSTSGPSMFLEAPPGSRVQAVHPSDIYIHPSDIYITSIMGNTESSSSPRTPPASEEEEDDEYYNDDDLQQEEFRLKMAIEETSLLLLSAGSHESSNASAASSSSPDNKTKKKKRRSVVETQSMINLHRESRDLFHMCCWVSALLKQLNSSMRRDKNTGITLAEDGYTPEETLHMLLFAAQQQQLLLQQQQQSSKDSNNNHPPPAEPPEDQHVMMDEISSAALQELNAQCVEYMTVHSQPGAPRIINATSRLRRRQRLIERPMTLLLSSSTSNSSASSSTANAFASSNYGAVVNENTNAQQEVEEELFYGLVKDDVNQRIVLVFHETPAMKSSGKSSSSWLDWLHLHQMHVPLPSTLQGKVPRDPNNTVTNSNTNTDFVDSISLRADLYHFLFSDKNQNDNSSNSNTSSSAARYQALLASVQHMLRAHPSYTFHVTGFYGRSAACAVMAAFFLAAEPQGVLYNHVLFNTNPIVNCLVFACPRVGDGHFLQACQSLEKGAGGGEPKQQQALDDDVDGGCRSTSSPLLRMGRIVVNDVNNTDASAQIPLWNFSHVGFQIRLYLNDKQDDSPDRSSSSSSNAASEITYPMLVDHWQNRWRRTRGNAISIPLFCKLLLLQSPQESSSSTAQAATARNYRLAIQQAQGHLQEYKEGLASLYKNGSSSDDDKDEKNNWTGF
jgi:Lipase (class 3)